jgi:hypothetical protein
MDAFLYVAAFTIGAYIFASQEPREFKPSRPSYDEERPIVKPPLRKRASSADLKKDAGFPQKSDPIDIPKKKLKKSCDCAML